MTKMKMRVDEERRELEKVMDHDVVVYEYCTIDRGVCSPAGTSE